MAVLSKVGFVSAAITALIIPPFGLAHAASFQGAYTNIPPGYYYLAADNTAPKWADIEGWTIRVDKTLGNGCFMLASYDNGSLLRVGLDPANDSIYFVIGNTKWRSIEVGKDYKLGFQFDRESPWTGTASGFAFSGDDQPFLLMDNVKAEVLRDFSRKHTLRIRYKDQEISAVTLRGSAKAMRELINCQSAFIENKPSASSRDPFSSGATSRKADPFQ